MDQKLSCKTTFLLREKMGKTRQETSTNKKFLGKILNGSGTSNKNCQMGEHKTEKLLSSKGSKGTTKETGYWLERRSVSFLLSTRLWLDTNI